MLKEEYPKIVESVDLSGWSIFDGEKMSPAKAMHRTVPYEVWEVKTERHSLECADFHFLFYEDGCRVLARELQKGDRILVDGGAEEVVSVRNTGRTEEMYDAEMDTQDHKWSTDGIVSHNTTTCTAFLLHYALFNPEKKIAILANKGAQAREIMQRIELAYLHLPKWLQCGIKTWNKGSMELANGSSIISATTSSDSIRGQSYSCVAAGTKIRLKSVDGTAKLVGIENACSSEFAKVRLVMTPTGWQSYSGISEREVNEIIVVSLKDGTGLECTPDHRLMLPDRSFIEAGDVTEGMILRSEKGNVKVASAIRHRKKTKVYDLVNVTGGNVYWTNELASHNCVLIDECLAGKETIDVRRKSDGKVMRLTMKEFWDMIQ